MIVEPLVLCNPGAPSCGPSVWTVPNPGTNRVVDVVVELQERGHQLRVLADLRTNRDQVAVRRLDEVPMRRNVGDEQV